MARAAQQQDARTKSGVADEPGTFTYMDPTGKKVLAGVTEAAARTRWEQDGCRGQVVLMPAYSYFDADGNRVLAGVSRGEVLDRYAEDGRTGVVAREQSGAPDTPTRVRSGGVVVAPARRARRT